MSILRATTQLTKTKESLEAKIAMLDEKKAALEAQLEGINAALGSLENKKAA